MQEENPQESTTKVSTLSEEEIEYILDLLDKKYSGLTDE